MRNDKTGSNSGGGRPAPDEPSVMKITCSVLKKIWSVSVSRADTLHIFDEQIFVYPSEWEVGKVFETSPMVLKPKFSVKKNG
ncbi:MAG: hypothetical protein L0220_03855 [Acidobacteria bacterium]|nr:hypothetical protein [Acidobacteriota bacterium]